jgi:hypothetical protein
VEGLIVPYASGAPIPPEAAAHISGCEHCRRLVRAIGETRQVGAPLPELLQRIADGVAADLKPVKPLAPEGVRFLALIVALAMVAAVANAVLGIAGWLALSELQRLAVFSALGASAGLLAFSLVRQSVPGSRLVLPPGLLVTAVLCAMASAFGVLFRPREESTFVATGLVCLRIGLECAIPAGIVFWTILRRGAVLNPALTGATAGALAGLSGLTALEILCPNPNVHHILVWHLGGTLASAAGGLAAGMIAEHFGGRTRG